MYCICFYETVHCIGLIGAEPAISDRFPKRAGARAGLGSRQLRSFLATVDVQPNLLEGDSLVFIDLPTRLRPVKPFNNANELTCQDIGTLGIATLK